MPSESSNTPVIRESDVAHLAHLARIDIPESQLAHYAEQLAVILESVARVGEVASSDVPATSHPMPLINVFRDDVPRPSLTQAQALSGAPAVEDGRFRVPRILDEE